jgi:alpha-L-fucosidase 2
MGRLLCTLLVALALSACDGTAFNASADGGQARDGSDASADAGGGLTRDGGGSRDAGGSADAGGSTDAAVSADGGGSSARDASTDGGGADGYPAIDIDGGPLTLWYDKPAGVWTEALPLGNGRIAAMVFGDPANDRLQLNESSFWSGGPSRNDNPKALGVLAQVRQLIFDGKYRDAESLINANFVTQLHGAKFQTIGDLRIKFTGHGSYSSYYRELDLNRAVATTQYKVDGVTYSREVFASQPDQVIVVRLSADQKGRLTFSLGIDGPLKKAMNVLDPNTLELTGVSSTHEGVTGQVRFDARVKVVNTGGTTAKTTSGISVTNADEVLLLVSIATNFVDYKTLTADEKAKSAKVLADVGSKQYDSLLASHVAAHQKYFNRVALDLGSSTSSLPTNQRIQGFASSNDRQLAALYFQFGRYLLVSSSQPGGQPANLQGIWNDSTDPAWDSKYTININTEMNYWPAEKCNLSEMQEPLTHMVQELSDSARQTASSMYGARGWVAHHNTDIWRIAGVVDFAAAGMWPMGGAWLSQHLWEHYLYTGDLTYLESVYPVLKSACEFYQDFLVEEPKNKWLVVSPSISPENSPASTGSAICAGATIDNQLLFDLFTKTMKAASLLGRDSDLTAKLQALLDRLPPMQVGNFGQLQEWMQDWDNPNDKNRHVSHLYGLFPSNQISPYATPQLLDAARTSLIHRGDVSTGWSMGWKVNFWARMLDGNHALKLIRDQLTPQSGGGGGTYPNLFDAHPPFQIDGNFGCTSGIAEMLLQTQDGVVHLLPALPDDWASAGGVRGLRAYGGFETDFIWKNGQVEKLVVRSSLGGNCRIRVPNEMVLSDASTLAAASGKNPNPFFATPTIKEPLVSSSAKLNDVVLRKTFEYDLQTKAGEGYVLMKKQ